MDEVGIDSVARQPAAHRHKVAVVVYTNAMTEAPSRAYRAFGFVAELLAHGDDVTLVFDGGGSATLAAVLDEKHKLHAAWTMAAPALRGVCGHCAGAYGVSGPLTTAGIPFLDDDKGHASLRALLDEGRQIVTF